MLSHTQNRYKDKIMKMLCIQVTLYFVNDEGWEWGDICCLLPLFHMETSPLAVKGCKFRHALCSWPLSSEGSLAYHTYTMTWDLGFYDLIRL